MRRLRDKLIAVTVPLIVLLLAATWVIHDTVIDRLSRTLAQRVSTSWEDLEDVRAKVSRRLIQQAHQMNDSAALREVLTTYVEARRKAEELARHPATPQKTEETERMLRAAESSLRDDVGPTEAANAGVDLMVMTNLEGKVVLSLREPDKENARVADHTEEDSKSTLASEPLVRVVLEGKLRHAASYFIYLDGRLYLAAAAPLLRGSEVEGVLLLGTRDFPLGSGVDVAYVAQGRVAVSYVSSNGQGGPAPAGLGPQASEDLSRFYRAWQVPEVDPPWKRAGGASSPLPLVTLSLAGRPYLSLPHPLWEVGREDPVAWAFLMLPMDTLLEPVVQAREMVIRLGAVVLTFSVILTIIIAGHITWPVEQLSRRMQLVGEGVLDVDVPLKGRDEVAGLARAFNSMLDGLREKERLAAYVPQKARDAIAVAKGRQALGAKRARATILFSDLRGFTTLSENLDPTDLVEMLNEYLEHMQSIIVRNGGYISDYIGDAIVAVFNEDNYDKRSVNSAARAVQAALEMQTGMADLRGKSDNVNVQRLRMGIGIHTGLIVEGDMGPGSRLKYAVLGDTVNTAARIQDRSKQGRHTCVLISGQTYDRVSHLVEADFFCEEVLRGKTTPVPIWEVISTRALVAETARNESGEESAAPVHPIVKRASTR